MCREEIVGQVSQPAKNIRVPTIPHGANRPELGEIIASFDDRAWLDDYLHLVRALLDHLGVESGDKRLAMSIPKRRSGWLLPVSINNRYVVAAHRRAGQTVVGVIHTPDFESMEYAYEPAITFGRFDSLPGEAEDETPYFVCVPEPRIVLENPQFLGATLVAAERELSRASASCFRKFHSDEFHAYVVGQGVSDESGDS